MIKINFNLECQERLKPPSAEVERSPYIFLAVDTDIDLVLQS